MANSVHGPYAISHQRSAMLSKRDSPLDRRRHLALRGDIFLDGACDEISVLRADQHPLTGEHGVIVAAFQDEVGDGDRIRLVEIERLAVDTDVAHPTRGWRARIDGHREARH